MTDLEALRSRIPAYADYADESSRHEVDKQIRAYLGEALAAARTRINPTAALLERLDGLILRCEFTDQRVIRAADHAEFTPPLVDRIHQLDREIVECSERIAAAADAAALGGELDAAARLLDERFGALADAPPRHR